eukprot:1695462-Rhodomonas_salina.1
MRESKGVEREAEWSKGGDECGGEMWKVSRRRRKEMCGQIGRGRLARGTALCWPFHAQGLIRGAAVLMATVRSVAILEKEDM